MTTKRKEPAEPSTRRTRQRTLSSTEPQNRRDPFEAFPWDIACLVLHLLSPQDLVRAQQVDRGWRGFVERWLIAEGRRALPWEWRPDIEGLAEEEAIRHVKQAVVEHTAYKKLAAGNASCARRYENTVPGTGLFSVKGDYVVWHADNRIRYQNLAFEPDGSLHQIEELDVTVMADNLRYLEVNAEGYLYYQMWYYRNDQGQEEGYRHHVVYLPTGTHVWRQRIQSNARLLAVGRERIYFYDMPDGDGANNLFFMARDVVTGRRLYRRPCANRIPGDAAPVPVQRLEGEEVLVALRVEPNFRLFVQIIDGKNGVISQVIGTAVWLGGEHIIPDSQNAGRFAIVSHSQNEHRYVKIQKFTENVDNDGLFDSVSIEWLAPIPRTINRLAIHPYRNLAVTIEHRRAIPWIREIRVNDDPPTDQQTFPHDDPPRPDRWLQVERGQKVSLPVKYKHHKSRRKFLRKLMDSGTQQPPVRFVGWDRVLMATSPEQFNCLLDFRFRLQTNFALTDGPHPDTLEIR
ncbi:uncharacterized protein BDV17DRAFT_293762 [Aspergillus undulatus]|uniref:uncharacterized protein n=1 Tax=Aspergillus undulatus TaxID=1810928 RepID=UPI003CCDAC0A